MGSAKIPAMSGFEEQAKKTVIRKDTDDSALLLARTMDQRVLVFNRYLFYIGFVFKTYNYEESLL